MSEADVFQQLLRKVFEEIENVAKAVDRSKEVPGTRIVRSDVDAKKHQKDE